MKGPYELLCKTADGDRISTFEKPVTVSLALDTKTQKHYLQFKAYIYHDDWQEATIDGATNSFNLDNGTNFVIMGQQKKTPLWQKILVVMLLLAALAVVVLAGLRLWYKRRSLHQLQQQASDYYKKERGY